MPHVLLHVGCGLLLSLVAATGAQASSHLTSIPSAEKGHAGAPAPEVVKASKTSTRASLPARAATLATGVTEFVLIDEDFSRFTKGTPDEPFCEGNLDWDNMLCSYYMTPPGLYIDDALTEMPGWSGSFVFQAGGCAVIWPNEGDWGHLNTPLGDYSGDITVTLKARAMPCNYDTSEIEIAPMVGGFSNVEYAKTDDSNSSYTFRLRDYEGWVEMTYSFRNYSADANGFISISVTGSVEVEYLKVTCNPSDFIAAPHIKEITDVTPTSFTANWDLVDNAFTYLVFLNRLDYLTESDAVYTADFEGTKPLDLPDWSISLGKQSGVVEDETSADNHVLLLRNGDMITAPEYIAKFRDVEFYLKAVSPTTSITGYLYLDLKKDDEWQTGLGFDLSWFTTGDKVSLDYEFYGDFANEYEGVRLRVGGLPDDAYLLLDDLKATTSRAGVLTPICLDPEFQELVDELLEYGETVPDEYLAWWLSIKYGDECSKYTFTDLDPEADYYYRVVAQRIGLRSDSKYQRAFVIAAPELLEASNVDSRGSYTANWEPVAKATGYQVNNYGAVTAQKDGMFTILEEEFSRVDSKADPFSPESLDNYFDITSFDDYADNKGWTGLGNVIANSCVGVMESYYVSSTLSSPALFLANNDWTRITLVAYGEADGTMTMRYGDFSVTLSFDKNGMIDGYLDLEISGSGNTLDFYSTDYNAFCLDYLKVEQDVKAGDACFFLLSSQEVGPDVTSATFSSLADTGYDDFAYDVVARYESDGATALSQSDKFMLVNLESGESRLYASITSILSTFGDNVAGEEIGRYSITGQPVDSSYRGIVIIRYADGTSRKALVK